MKYDSYEENEVDDFYQYNDQNTSMSGIFKLNWKDVLSAATSAALVALLMYVTTLTDVYTIDVHHAVNVVVLTAATSLLKALLTTDTGSFVGVVPVK